MIVVDEEENQKRQISPTTRISHNCLNPYVLVDLFVHDMPVHMELCLMCLGLS